MSSHIAELNHAQREVDSWLRHAREAAVVREGISVQDLSRRNHVLAVCREPSDRFIRKMPRPGLAARSIEHERGVLEAFSEHEPELANHIPILERSDRHATLLMSHSPTSMPATQAIRDRGGDALVPVAASLGQWLGSVHSCGGLARAVDDVIPENAASLPWALKLDRLPTSVFIELTDAARQAIRIAQNEEILRSASYRVREDWNDEALIHGDLKWDNIIVDEACGPSSFTIIDWELAGRGDPRWDVGSMFAACLTLWLGSTPFMSAGSPDQLLGLASISLSSIQPIITAFWSSYVKATSGLTGARSDHDFEFTAVCCALHLAQIALERAQLRATLSADVIIHMQVALNIAERPRDASRHLLAIV